MVQVVCPLRSAPRKLAVFGIYILIGGGVIEADTVRGTPLVGEVPYVSIVGPCMVATNGTKEFPKTLEGYQVYGAPYLGIIWLSHCKYP